MRQRKLISIDKASNTRILNKWRLSIVLTMALFTALEAVASEDAFIMSTSVGAPLYQNDKTGLFNLLVAEIFKRLDIDYKLVHLPAARAIVFTNNATVDGTVPRAAAIEKNKHNLVRVPVNIFDFEYMAYTKNPAIKIKNWQDVKSYKVGIINGWKIVEKNLADVKSVVKVSDLGQLLNLLEKGRVDVAILDRVMGSWKFKELGLDLIINEPALITKPNFAYVHIKHKKLVPEIARVVSEMKLDGTYEAIYAKSISGVMSH